MAIFGYGELLPLLIMAYNLHYYFYFKNLQNDTFQVQILEKDYVGGTLELIGTGKPFMLEYQSGDQDIYSAIKPSVGTIEFYSQSKNGTRVRITDFYNNADDTFRIDILSPDTVVLWSGFVQIDNSAEDFQDISHAISLVANDNLGLLQRSTWNDISGTYGFFKLTEVLALILPATGLSLTTQAYLNIFENTTNDRTVVSTDDCLQQTVVHSNYFLNNDGTFKDCYTILQDLLTGLRATICQCNGSWAIFRQAEFRIFTSALVPGTLYDSAFNVLSAIQTPAKIAIGIGLDLHFLNANQQRRILKPLQYSRRTLTYSQPQWIDDQRFTVLGNLLMGGGIYNSILYVLWASPSDWYDPSSKSYIATAYDTTLGNTEIRRFMGLDKSVAAWMQFNAIPVIQNSRLAFTCSWFAAYYGDPAHVIPPPGRGDMWNDIRFQLATSGGDVYNLKVDGSGFLIWDGPYPIAGWNGYDGLQQTSDMNDGNLVSYDLSSFDAQSTIPVFPVAGVLLIGIYPNRNNIQFYDIGIQNIELTIENNLGVISSMTAQQHNYQQALTIKNNSDIAIEYDDTIVNTIRGTLLTDSVTNYNAYVGNYYTTRTANWHRAALTESLKLNQINTFDTLFTQRIQRTIIEGDVRNIHYRLPGGVSGTGGIGIDPPIIEISGRANADGILPGMILQFQGETYTILTVIYDAGLVKVTTNPAPSGPDYPSTPYVIRWPIQFVCLLNIFTIDSLPGKNFLPNIMAIDFRNAKWNAALYELFDNGEVDGDLTATYSFNYIFKTN